MSNRSSSHKKFFSLQQVAKSIQNMLVEKAPQPIWIKAELHKLNASSAGHCYPEFLQKEGEKIVAQMRGTIWVAQYRSIQKKFVEIVKEPLKDGSQILLLAKIQYHEIYGISLTVWDIDPYYALGELEKEKEATLLRLSQLGLLNLNQQLPIALLPKKLAIVSAANSKGYADFMKTIEASGYQFDTFLFTAQLQGDQAVGSILHQLDIIAKLKHHFDCVLILRGGGGEVGMSCYNHIDLCTAIARFPLPIITGIGHSTNLTVAEMIAFQNGITPTAVAHLLIKPFEEWEDEIARFQSSIAEHCHSFLELKSTKLAQIALEIKRNSRHLIQLNHLELKSCRRRLLGGYDRRHRQEEQRLHQVSVLMGKEIPFFLTRKAQGQVDLQHRLLSILRQKISYQHLSQGETIRRIKWLTLQKLQQWKQNSVHLEAEIEWKSPKRWFEKGYSLTLFNGKPISADNMPVEGDPLVTENHWLRIDSRIEGIKHKEDE